MLKINPIIDKELSELMEDYEKALSILRRPPYYIDNIPDYSYYLSRLLKSIENDSNTYYSEIIKRIKFNSSFEEQLLNHGNSLKKIPNGLNLQEILVQISQLICNRNKKVEVIFDEILKITGQHLEEPLFKEINYKPTHQCKVLIICNNYDEDFLNEYIGHKALKNIEVNRYKKFIKRKEDELRDYYIIGYFLEGYRDFNVYHNLSVLINLYLYDFENGLYNECLNQYKLKLETELSSEDRYFLSGIKYESLPPLPISISQIIQSIIERTKNWNDNEFDLNIDDPDENSNELISYQIEYEGKYDTDYLKSTDTVFDHNNNLIKVNRLSVGLLIRVYKLDFGEILLNTAMEFQQEEFLEIEKNSQLWKSVLKELYLHTYNANIAQLHYHLKNHGVKVLPATVLNNWVYGKTKFPQSDKSLKAIYELSKDIRLGASVGMILKSKRIYNSTLISLGRDLKEEIKNFLINESVGEIIKQNNVSIETLRKTIDQQMPLKKVKNINSKVISAEDMYD